MPMSKRLIICAGERIKPGWATHDVQNFPNIDIQCEFWDLPQYVEAGSMKEIEFTHALEHFPMEQSVTVLHAIWNLLEDGGKLYIEVPNFYWHAQEIIENPSNRQIIEYAFGGQLNKWDFHYNGYTPQILEEDLNQAGFDIEFLHPNSSIECMAVKSG